MRKVFYRVKGIEVDTYDAMKELESKFKTKAEIILKEVAEAKPKLSPKRAEMLATQGFVS